MRTKLAYKIFNMICLLLVCFLGMGMEKEDSYVITQAEKEIIAYEVEKVAGFQEKFDSLFNQWLENWKTNPETMFSSSTLDAKKLEEYPQLLAMGKEIIPLLMEKLLDENNFVGLVLYDDLQDNPDYKIVYDYEGTDWLEGEVNRAKRTIKLWIKSLEHEEINKE